MRRWLTLLLVISVATAWCAPAITHADDGDPAQAAREIADARERANAAAQVYFDQQSVVDELDTEQAQLSTQIAAAQQLVDELESKADEVAVTRYVNSGSAGLPLLDSFRSVDDQVQMQALIDVVAAGSADDFDRYRAARAALDAQQAALDAKKQDAVTEQRRLDQLRKDAVAEVAHLKQVQADRLQDAAVRAALAAEEAQRTRTVLQAAAASSGSTTSTTISPTVAGGANADNGNPAAGGADGDVEALPVPTTTSATPGAAIPGVAATTTSTTAGPTGAGGVAGRVTPVVLPTPAAIAGIGGVGGDYGGPGFVCPTGTAAVSFSDTWGAPRSGGRRHEGVDMIGTRGTPILAVVDGVAVAKENVLGGMTVSLTGTDGNRYYYAHLDGYVNLGNVTAGTQIGILGQTGNAVYSVPHLHFEVHPGGGPAVDPYPTARAHC